MPVVPQRSATGDGTSPTEEAPVGIGDKIENKLNEVKGGAKENIGDATDDRSLEAEGQADQAGAKVSQAGEHVKDAARDVNDAVTK
jgi:uncharacterized protein YjbJ (UPF0337 family)